MILNNIYEISTEQVFKNEQNDIFDYDAGQISAKIVTKFDHVSILKGSETVQIVIATNKFGKTMIFSSFPFMYRYLVLFKYVQN